MATNNGAVHATDATNASRTLLFNIRSGSGMMNSWHIEHPKICSAGGERRASDFGETSVDLFGTAISINGVAGDQQAAAIGQSCFSPGMLKSTYGTGCFALLNTGPTCLSSNHRLLSTVAYQLNGEITYALEGSIFVAGAVVRCYAMV